MRKAGEFQFVDRVVHRPLPHTYSNEVVAMERIPIKPEAMRLIAKICVEARIRGERQQKENQPPEHKKEVTVADS
jgi:hypothetical protein